MILDKAGKAALQKQRGSGDGETGGAERERTALMAPPVGDGAPEPVNLTEAVRLLAKATGYSAVNLSKMAPETLTSVLGPRGLLDTREAQALLAAAPLWRQVRPSLGRQHGPL